MKVTIIKDSINSYNDSRLTTFILEFPRFINAEFLRHRMLSFNSASSRAIPSKKLIKDIMENPAMPVFWGKNQSGMQAYEKLENDKKDEGYFFYGELENSLDGDFSNDIQIWSKGNKHSAQILWESARNSMVAVAERLQEIGLHKQIANRILEPWQNITLIVTGTEWENFFKLRASEFAQPEFKILAEMMLEEYNKSIPEIKTPIKLNYIDDYEIEVFIKNNPNINWHIPYEDKMLNETSKFDMLKISVARCARVSYMTHDGIIDTKKDFELFDRLVTSGHWSPCEHVAFPTLNDSFVGNFKGWFQFRKLFSNENQIDPRVIKKVVKGDKVENGII
jgi:thymidylate synthase ThyX